MELVSVLPQEICEMIETKRHQLIVGENNKLLKKLFEKYNNDYSRVLKKTRKKHLYFDKYEACAKNMTDKQFDLYLLIHSGNQRYIRWYRSHLELGVVFSDEEDDDDDFEEEQEEEVVEVLDYNNFDTPINYNPVIYVWEEPLV